MYGFIFKYLYNTLRNKPHSTLAQFFGILEHFKTLMYNKLLYNKHIIN